MTPTHGMPILFLHNILDFIVKINCRFNKWPPWSLLERKTDYGSGMLVLKSLSQK